VERVIVLVDGFNTYYGLRSRFGRRYLWLDLQALSASLLKDGQELRQVVYFTARVRNSVESVERLSVYLDALAAHCPNALHRLCPAKRLIAAFPPGRTSAAVRSAADGAFHVGQAKIRQAQLPEAVMSPHGVTLRRPACWC